MRNGHHCRCNGRKFNQGIGSEPASRQSSPHAAPGSCGLREVHDMETTRLYPASTVDGPRHHLHHDAEQALRIVRNAALAIGCMLSGVGPAPIGVALAQTGYNPDGASSGYAGRQNLGVAQVAYYVNGSSSSCSDAGPGTQIAPYCTITAALTAHHDPGTTLYVMPGVYHEQITLPASGVSGSPLVLQGLGSPSNPVVIDGADDFSDPARWTQYSGDVWLAASVSWSPLQVFADNQRLTPSSAPPGSLPPRSFEYVSGAGLYVNAGGGNPGTHRAEVGHRLYGVNASARSWVTIDGFTVTRCEARCINLSSSCSNVVIAHNVVTFSGKYGIQVPGNSTGQTLYDCIAVDNGLTTSEYDLWVEGTSQSGFVSDDNLFWNSISQPPIKWDGSIYSSVADYSAATGHDTRTLQANPKFVAPAQGDFHLMAGSPAIDDANSGSANWPSTDAEGKARADDPATANTGRGSITYADRGAL